MQTEEWGGETAGYKFYVGVDSWTGSSFVESPLKQL